MPRNARMSDVARLAGVSTMTVSRVLNESQNVTPSMRERVFAAVQELRYQPNELARSLREQRTRQIGILVPYLFDPFFAICAHAISTVAKQHAYSVILSTSGEDPEAEFREASSMLRRNVEGLIVIPARPSRGRSRLLGEEFGHLPIVTLDRPVDEAHFDSLLVENEVGSCRGTEHLLSLGHKRIAYIGLAGRLYTMERRLAGYTAAMNAVGQPVSVVQLSGVLDDSLKAVRRLLSGRHPPTALFSANNLITLHVLHSLRTMHLTPPRPVALVGFDDFEAADLLSPGVTVVRQPNEELGRRAAEMLFARLAEGDRPNGDAARRTTLPVELVVRGSCGATPETVAGADA